MIREGRLEDLPRAAPMRQRAWPDTIITEEGMRHSLQCVPQRAEFELFAYEEDGQIWGWATAGRAWWHHDPEYGTVTIAVDPDRRGRRIASKLAEAADAHLTALGIRTTRTESLDEPVARALAARWDSSRLERRARRRSTRAQSSRCRFRPESRSSHSRS
jgi:GNAT superfamily N-acetyltransferase